MAELPCPMCAKPNSDKLDVCAFCGARLKPLVASSPDNRALPSWLRDLHSQDGQPPPAEPAKPFADEGLPPASEPESAPQPADAKLPDWLAGLDSGAEEEKEVPEWLASIRDKTQMQPETPAEEEPFTQPEGADWLGRLRQGEEGKQAQPASGAPPFPPESAPIAPVPLESLPDWFSDLKSEPAPAAPEPAQATSGEAKPSDTCKNTGTLELPGWLADIQAEPEKGPAAPAAEPGPAPSEELPDWLMKLQAESKAPTYELPHVDIPFEESPDWLAKLQASAFAEEEKPPAAAVPAGKAAPEPTPPAEAPDWLGKLPASAYTEPERPTISAFTPEIAPPPGAIPDWLAEFKTEAPPAQEEPAAQVFASTPEPKPVEEPGKPLPDWLADFEKSAASAEVPSLTGPEEAAAVPAGDSEPSFPMETPDWLSMLKPEQGEEEVPAEAGEKPDMIAPAELPSWVQAMRPVEAVVAESEVPQEEREEETAVGGPLAGLSGVLPLSPGLGPLRKPQAYSARLQMTEGQQRHAASLERLVSTESEPRPLSGQTRLHSASLLRWAIALLLILAAGLPVVTGIQTVPGAVYPSELSATRDLISGLGTNSPVLLVFDYEPALSGELEAAAAPVIDHLLFKGPRLAILSTSPTGPILAERFLKTTQASHGYQSGQGYVNLGYLAGGPAGVLGFAEDPPATAAYTVEGAPAWQMPPLQGLQNLSDFAAVIILTDNADTGRTWIEQAGPYLNTSPMMMIISAQAEPMIRPYYDSQQVKGLVSGLAGGKAYEQANEQAFQGPGLARGYWDAFSAGLFLAEVMILVGGLWSAIAGWHARRNKPEEGT